ncbi:MAG: decarboxylase, partial [Moorea sp. SIO2B7]|nr:decarboxylase [Moorena sp. SIO2B7]
PDSYFCRRPQIRTLPKDAFFSRKEKLPIGQALGKISGCCIKKIPPGSPILIPGEEVTNWHLKVLEYNTMIDIIF